MELDPAQSLGRPLFEQEFVIGRVIAARYLGIGFRIEEIVGHELDDQGHVDMHRAFEFRKHGQLVLGDLEERLVLESLGRDHVVQQVHHLFPFTGNLHFHHGVVEEITAVVRRGRTHIVLGPFGEKFHGHNRQ